MREEAAGYIMASGVFRCSEGDLSVAEVEAARRNFKAYDVDNDDIISRKDFERLMLRYDPIWGETSKEAELDEMYTAVDLDGTGHVDFLKFAAMRVRKKSEMGERNGASGEKGSPRKGAMIKKVPKLLDILNPVKLGCLCFSSRENDGQKAA